MESNRETENSIRIMRSIKGKEGEGKEVKGKEGSQCKKMFTIREVRYDNKDFIRLCGELDCYLNAAIGGEDKREKYKKYNHLDTMDYVAIVYDGEKAVGCGALRRYSNTEIEVKRVFLQEEYRGRNIGGILLGNLVEKARELGFQRMILETGLFLDASLRLYRRFGFERIPNYGGYQNMEESYCMAREIGADAVLYCEGRRATSEQLYELFHSVGWMSARYVDRMENAYKNAGLVVTAWRQDRLIGLAEVLDDGELTAYIHYLLVEPQEQGKGIGRHLIEMVREHYKNYLYLLVISENRDVASFYQKTGFNAAEGTVVFQIMGE
ncbi:MAG: GNAT family N-acetyltransferase [Lachnospiraceae bacterium]|nr:GNAT family N-acetyltransferase [Lachnospiraceae bacterium]